MNISCYQCGISDKP